MKKPAENQTGHMQYPVQPHAAACNRLTPTTCITIKSPTVSATNPNTTIPTAVNGTSPNNQITTDPSTHTPSIALKWNHIAFYARFNTEAAKNIHETYAFNIDGYPHYAVVDGGTMISFEGCAPNPAFTLTTSSEIFLSVLEGQNTFVNTIASGDMTLEGNLEALQRCMTIFNKKGRLFLLNW
jgi:putative sterol carrier protein